MSSVWEYAAKLKTPITKEIEGQCGRCNKIMKCSGNFTTTLNNHLKIHGIDFDKPAGGCTSKEEPVNNKITKAIADFLGRNSLKENVTDLATDGISIRAITRNKYIQQSISGDEFKLLMNESNVMMLVHDDYEEKRNKTIADINEKMERGVKFSMTVDEYTTVRGRRFFGVNIHDSGDKKTDGSCSHIWFVHCSRYGLITETAFERFWNNNGEGFGYNTCQGYCCEYFI